MSASEAVARELGLSEFEVESFRDAFRAFDRDGDGTVPRGLGPGVEWGMGGTRASLTGLEVRNGGNAFIELVARPTQYRSMKCLSTCPPKSIYFNPFLVIIISQVIMD